MDLVMDGTISSFIPGADDAGCCRPGGIINVSHVVSEEPIYMIKPHARATIVATARGNGFLLIAHCNIYPGQSPEQPPFEERGL
jgi:hypothetical protein